MVTVTWGSGRVGGGKGQIKSLLLQEVACKPSLPVPVIPQITSSERWSLAGNNLWGNTNTEWPAPSNMAARRIPPHARAVAIALRRSSQINAAVSTSSNTDKHAVDRCKKKYLQEQIVRLDTPSQISHQKPLTSPPALLALHRSWRQHLRI